MTNESKWAKPKNAPTMAEAQLLETRAEIHKVIFKAFSNDIEPVHLILMLVNTIISFALTIAKDDRHKEMIDSIEDLFAEGIAAARGYVPSLQLLYRMQKAAEDGSKPEVEDLLEMLKAAGLLKPEDRD